MEGAVHLNEMAGVGEVGCAARTFEAEGTRGVAGGLDSEGCSDLEGVESFVDRRNVEGFGSSAKHLRVRNAAARNFSLLR